MNNEIKQRFTLWWENEDFGEPLLKICGTKDDVDNRTLVDITKLYNNPMEYHISPEVRVALVENEIATTNFYADAFPYVDLNMGPGSMAAYLKCEPRFFMDTVWYEEAKIDKLEDLNNISFEKSTKWWDLHLNNIKKAVLLADGRFDVCIPDIQENLDIVSAMRTPQNLCFDLYDEPGMVKNIQATVDKAFYNYFDLMYEAVKNKDNSSSFTVFSIWGNGKTAKIQCDFSTLISCETFDEYIIPSLKKQCGYIDNTLYHLDGKDAIRHIDSVLKIDKLNAVQWTSGAGQEDGGSEMWFPLYDKIKNADKALWIQIYNGAPEEWIYKAKKIVKRYGTKGIYFIFPTTTDCEAKEILSSLKN